MVRRILKRVRSEFDQLGSYPCLDDADISDFNYYREVYEDALYSIDQRIRKGEFEPVDLKGFPQILNFPRYEIKVAMFIGSFDPFQMTHLAMALRYLASSSAKAPLVLIVPEGHHNPDKPKRSDYHYRYDILSKQIKGIFQPLIHPLDLGEGADTIEIVRRFIARFPDARISLTHLIGSDVLDTAVSLLPEDLAVWKKESKSCGVDFSYEIFVIRRDASFNPDNAAEIAAELGIEVNSDDRVIGTPSSTDFRSNRMFSIVFPTKAVMRHMEVLFRYDLNRPWSPGSEEDPR
jgi:hypothetical protein